MSRGQPCPLRLAEHVARIERWQGSREPRPYYRPDEITRAVGAPMRAIGEALTVLGWRRVRVRGLDGEGRQRTVWAPPGSRLVQGGRGRPRFDLVAALQVEPRRCSNERPADDSELHQRRQVAVLDCGRRWSFRGE